MSPDQHEFLLQRSTLYLELKEYDRTIEDLTKALTMKPNDPYILYRKGVSFYLNKKFKKALKYLHKALAVGPYPTYISDIYYHIGISYSYLEEFSLSIEPLSRAIEECRFEAVYYWFELKKCIF